MLIYLSWTNVIISGDTFCNTINKTSTSVIDSTYPTFLLFSLVRFGVIIIPLPHIIVIILSFSFPLLQYNWGIWLLTVTDTLFKEIDSHSIKLWLKYTSSNNYYYNIKKWKSKWEVGAYHSVLFSSLPLSNVGKLPTHNVPMKYATILLQLKCCLLSLICWVFFTKFNHLCTVHHITKKKYCFISYACWKPCTGHKCVSGKPLGCTLLTQIINSTNATIQCYKSFF